MKASAVSTITKSLPIEFPSLVNYYLLATLGYINLFNKKSNPGYPLIGRMKGLCEITGLEMGIEKGLEVWS